MGCKIHPSDKVSFLVWNPQNVNLTLLDGSVSANYPWLVVCNGSYMHILWKNEVSKSWNMNILKISSHAEVIGGQKFAAFWKTIHILFKRRISFFLIMPDKKKNAALFAEHIENGCLIRSLTCVSLFMKEEK